MSNRAIDFDLYEINALNKLLGDIKFERDLSADEINSFAGSPYISSAFKKIHVHFLELFQQADIDNPGSGRDNFLLSNDHSITDVIDRINRLGRSGKEYIKSLTEEDRLAYCMALFAPFIPTSEQKIKMLETFSSLT